MTNSSRFSVCSLVLRLIFMLCGLAILIPPASADLILNGSFELPGISGTSGFGPGREQYTAASQGIPNWTVSGAGDIFLHKTPDIGNDRLNPSYNFAQEGNFYLDLSGSNLGGNHATIYQEFATTPLTTYAVSFYIGAANETPPSATINVQLTGSTSILNTTLTPLAPSTNINWTHETFNFVANSSTTRLSFRDTSSTDDNSSFVDNVSVVPQATPEPSSIAILSIGSLAFLAQRWRFKAQRARKRSIAI